MEFSHLFTLVQKEENAVAMKITW